MHFLLVYSCFNALLLHRHAAFAIIPLVFRRVLTAVVLSFVSLAHHVGTFTTWCYRPFLPPVCAGLNRQTFILWHAHRAGLLLRPLLLRLRYA